MPRYPTAVSFLVKNKLIVNGNLCVRIVVKEHLGVTDEAPG